MAECYFRMEDDIVKDSLKSIDFENGNLLIVGGLAVQFFGQGCLDISRRTLDLDLISQDTFSFDSFRDSFKPFMKDMKLKGYQVQAKKGNQVYSLKVMDSQNRPDSKYFFVNLEYHKDKTLNYFGPYLHKQFDHELQVPFEDGEVIFPVQSLEELAPLKVGRVRRMGKNSLYSDMFTNLETMEGLERVAKIPLESMAINIKNAQNILSVDTKNIEVKSQYKLSKDCYDLVAIAKLVSAGQYDFNFDRYNENLDFLANMRS